MHVNCVQIVNPETGEHLPLTSTGEICVRGPQVMMGYQNRPEETAATKDSEGWIRTGKQQQVFYVEGCHPSEQTVVFFK